MDIAWDIMQNAWGVKKYNERIINAIKAMLAACKTAEDYLIVSTFAHECLENYDESGNEIQEVTQIKEEIAQKLLGALQKSH